MSTGVPFAERGGAVRGLLDLGTGCYPAFLFGGPLRGVLPVFHFHEVTREWLEPRLQYLAENSYRTVTCDEIARFVVDGIDPGQRSVGLTFDDAWSSVWTVAAPLLRQYGLTAILFAIPARVPEARDIRAPVESSTGEEGDPPFATWPELQAMHASGVVDIQSHTRSHVMMFSDARVVGFVTPEYAREPLLGRPLTSSNGVMRFLGPDALGTPLHVRRSRMSDARRFLADESLAERCRDLVRREGGPRFFQRSNWRSQLEAIAGTGSGRYETESDQVAVIREELALGRDELNQRLGTQSVRHVALPWGIAGEVTRRALAETGHETAFAERPLRRRGVYACDDRFQLMRLNGKFLTCLPGRRRHWFFTTVR